MAKGPRKKTDSKRKRTGSNTSTGVGRHSTKSSDKPPRKSGVKEAGGSRHESSVRAATPPIRTKPASAPDIGDLRRPLPEGYGENDLFIIAVDPEVIYSSWEVTAKDIPRKADALVLRVLDVTGVDFSGGNDNCHRDIPLRSRIGTGFFRVDMPGRDVVVEIGCLDLRGKYRMVLRSNRVSMPQWPRPGELTSWWRESDGPPGY